MPKGKTVLVTKVIEGCALVDKFNQIRRRVDPQVLGAHGPNNGPYTGPSNGPTMAHVCELPNLRHLRVFQAAARLWGVSGASRERAFTAGGHAGNRQP